MQPAGQGWGAAAACSLLLIATHHACSPAPRRRFIEVARAAVWSLARIAASVLHPSRPALRAGLAGPAAPAWVQLLQMWPRMQAQALQMVVEMMSSCQLKVGGRSVEQAG
jgi:hypothetical protein